MTKKKKETQMVGQVTEPIVLQATISANDLKAKLEDLKNRDGVIGYILRNTTSASIDLKDPSKIIDFAVLSSSAIDASKELSEIFDLGNVNSTVVEGGSIKMLSMTINENRISIFMEKNVDCEALRNTLCAKGPN